MGEEEERRPDSQGVTQPRPTERGRIPSPPLPGSSARGRTSPEPALLLHQGGGIANVSQGSHVCVRVHLFLCASVTNGCVTVGPGRCTAVSGGAVGIQALGRWAWGVARRHQGPGSKPSEAWLLPSSRAVRTQKAVQTTLPDRGEPPTACLPVQPCHVSTSTFGHMALLLWASLCQ